MELIFTRTGDRRYSIKALRRELPAAIMDPAPGYDEFLPHDVMHMVVEAELGLTRAVFGQLEAGGLAGTFRLVPDVDAGKKESSRQRRKADSKDEKLLSAGKDDSAKSERATYICWYEWLRRSKDPQRQRSARKMAENAKHVRDVARSDEMSELSDQVVDTICGHLDRLSSSWSALLVGQSMRVRWPDLKIVRER